MTPTTVSSKSPSLKLGAVFPFHLQFDREYRATSVGPALQKFAPALIENTDIRPHLQIVRPRYPWNFDQLMKKYRSLVIVQLPGTHINLRYEAVADMEDECITLLGSVWNCSPESLEDFGVTMDDFALHDPGLDAVLNRQVHELQLSSMKQTIAKLQRAVADKDRLEAAEQMLLSDLNASADLVMRFSQDARILEVRSIAAGLLPKQAIDIIGTRVHESLPFLSDHYDVAQTWITDSQLPLAFEYDFHMDDKQHYFEARFAPSPGNILLLLAKDITPQRELESQLRYQATHDPLTKLPNRRLFEAELHKALRLNRLAAVLFIDLDDFKTANDTFGHAFGDRVLVEVAERIREVVGEDGFSARLGGDEFGVFLPSIDNKVQAQAVADRLLDKMSIPVELDGKTVNANGSIGVAVGDANVDTNEMFRNADLAMYRSKSSKKNAAVFFDSKMYETVREAYDVLTDMRRGLHENEFLCHYQPIVDLKTSTTIGLEALVRWEHPTRGLLAPSAFIEVAEESGLITEMGCQVMELACRETAELNRSLDEPLTIHVNLSPIQVQEVGIEDRIPQLLKEIGLDPGLLKLEITESTLFDDFEMAEAVFKCLQDSGVSVALDDFGVGYSSLSYLERFPINLLKLDRSFIQDIGESDRRLHIVETMVQMGRALEMQVVAEGVETAEQAEILRNIGCQFAQGYWFSKPVPIEAVKHCVGQLPKQ